VAGRSAVLNIRIASDASGASRGFADAETRVQRFERGLDRASVAAGALLAGVGAIATHAVDAASRLEQSAGAIESVFGSYAGEIERAAQGAAATLGLSQSAYQDMAAVFGASLQNMGMDAGTASGQTQDLITLGADLAATYGGTTADAVSALGSLLRGETDPIERYGVGIKQADINARLAAMGMEGLEGEAGKLAQAQAVLGLLTEQTTGALGASARESGTVASRTEQAKAAFDNAAAALGTALLPMVAAVAGELAELAQWVAENTDVVVPLVAAIGGLAGGILAVNFAIKAYRAIAVIATAAQWLWNAAMAANPIGLIVLAIAAVVAGIVWAYTEFEVVRDVVDAVVGAVVGYFRTWIDAIGWVWDKVSNLGDVFASVFDWILGLIQPVIDAIAWVADKLSWIGDAASWVGDLFSAGVNVNVAGGTGGMMGAAAGMRGAPLIAGAAGGVVGSSGGPGAAPGMVVNVTVNGAIDPVATGRQIEKVLRDYGRATGRQVALAGRP
jgi:hypothetical protein